jgi:maleylacetoacetate isomerase
VVAVKLYGYWRSSSAYRARIACEIKGIQVESVPVHLVREGGEQYSDAFLAVNPEGRVPALVDGDVVISQSLAIIEYLDETQPGPRLLPDDASGRARVRSLAQIVASDVQPLQNLSVLKYLTGTLAVDEPAKLTWIRYWIARGFRAMESKLSDPETGDFCHGDAPGLADCFLVPQVYNALRYECPMDDYPRLHAIYTRCESLPEFQRAAPEAQPDAV